MKKTSAEDLIFLDESGANLQMAPRYGRAYGKERVYVSAPYQRGKKITMMSAISIEQVQAAMYGQWSANGDIFSEFIEKSLCPKLRPNHVVIMDNVSFHKTKRILELISKTGAKLLYLPPYHPELNPIEEMWSKIKTKLRKLSARTLFTFKRAIKIAFESVEKSDLQGWFSHAGYQ